MHPGYLIDADDGSLRLDLMTGRWTLRKINGHFLVGICSEPQPFLVRSTWMSNKVRGALDTSQNIVDFCFS